MKEQNINNVESAIKFANDMQPILKEVYENFFREKNIPIVKEKTLIQKEGIKKWLLNKKISNIICLDHKTKKEINVNLKTNIIPETEFVFQIEIINENTIKEKFKEKLEILFNKITKNKKLICLWERMDFNVLFASEKSSNKNSLIVFWSGNYIMKGN